mmetsp:Transcript_14942/g.19826  ORF Transcript_14942/g.19826 Transcript_14942/m.19826 type:complete len:134 (-) Transcript_14942:183-584(-)
MQRQVAKFLTDRMMDTRDPPNETFLDTNTPPLDDAREIGTSSTSPSSSVANNSTLQKKTSSLDCEENKCQSTLLFPVTNGEKVITPMGNKGQIMTQRLHKMGIKHKIGSPNTVFNEEKVLQVLMARAQLSKCK